MKRDEIEHFWSSQIFSIVYFSKQVLIRDILIKKMLFIYIRLKFRTNFKITKSNEDLFIIIQNEETKRSS